VSTVKLLMEENDLNSGVKYSSMAAFISHEEGLADPVNREKVRW